MLALAATPAGAQGGWSQPFEVSAGARFSWFPSVVAGSDGAIHIFWASGEPDPQHPTDGEKAIDLLRYRALRDGAWSEINDILFAGLGGYTVRNSEALGRDGRIHLLVRKQTQLYMLSASELSAWSARDWSQPEPLSPAGAYYTALAADSAGRLHAFWSQAMLDDPQSPNPTCPSCADLFYRRSDDGGQTWQPFENLSQTPDGENRPQVKIDGRDRIHLAWDEGVDWYAGAGVPKAGVYRRSDDGGRTWTQPIYFTVGGHAVQQTSLALGAQGDPLVVFRGVDDSRVYFAYSTDGGDSWGPPGEIPGVVARSLNDNNLDTYALATDSLGRIHLLMVGFPAGVPTDGASPQLLHLTWDGRRWSAPEALMANELFPEWPQLAVSAGNQLHAAWFTRHRDDLFGSEKSPHYQVWYSERALDGPTLPPLPTFTPVPTVAPNATSAPTIGPTPTLLPAAVVRAATIDGPPAWEQRGIDMIALALLPTLGLLGLLVGVVVIVVRRR